MAACSSYAQRCGPAARSMPRYSNSRPAAARPPPAKTARTNVTPTAGQIYSNNQLSSSRAGPRSCPTAVDKPQQHLQASCAPGPACSPASVSVMQTCGSGVGGGVDCTQRSGSSIGCARASSKPGPQLHVTQLQRLHMAHQPRPSSKHPPQTARSRWTGRSRPQTARWPSPAPAAGGGQAGPAAGTRTATHAMPAATRHAPTWSEEADIAQLPPAAGSPAVPRSPFLLPQACLEGGQQGAGALMPHQVPQVLVRLLPAASLEEARKQLSGVGGRGAGYRVEPGPRQPSSCTNHAGEAQTMQWEPHGWRRMWRRGKGAPVG